MEPSLKDSSTMPPNPATAPTAKLLRAGKPDQLVSASVVGSLLGLTAKAILNGWRRLGLPAPVKLGSGPRATCRWWLSEVQAYIDSLTQKRDTRFAVVARDLRRRAG